MKRVLRRARPAITAVFLAAVIALAAREIYLRRSELGDALSSMPIGDLVLSFACALAGVATTMLGWRHILAALGARLSVAQGARVFFIGQLGKYLPGSVWPLLAQAELAKQVGAKRTVTVAANLVFTGVMVTVGIVLGAALLPFTSPQVFDDYWWLLLALPFLLLGLYPPLVRWGLDLVLGILRRPKLDGPIDPWLYARSVAVIVVSWLLLGTHIYLLVRALGPRDVAAFVAAVGGIGLATGAGILFIPAPAGAGVREVVLTLALSPLLTRDQALSVALVSRVAMILTDFTLGGSQAFSGRAARRQVVESARAETRARPDAGPAETRARPDAWPDGAGAAEAGPDEAGAVDAAPSRPTRPESPARPVDR